MQNDVIIIQSAPVTGIILDTAILAVFITIVAGIIGCVAFLNAFESRRQGRG